MMAVREQMKRISEERVSIKFQGQEHAWWGGVPGMTERSIQGKHME